jgi:hypothetical protein
MYFFIFLFLQLLLHLLVLGENPVVEDLAFVFNKPCVEMFRYLKAEGGKLLGLIALAQPLEEVR